jgi:hypothetical protein
MSAIETFLSTHSEYNAFEVLCPENVALCLHNGNIVHISVDKNAELIDTEVLEQE